MKIKKIIHHITFLPLLAIFLGACNSQGPHKEIKLAHGLDITHPVHKGMEYMAKMVDKKSGGKLKVKIYPSEQLGTERECLEMLQIGSLDMTKVSAAIMEGFVPKYKVLGLPYLFRNSEHAYKVFDGKIGKEILLAGEEYWLRGMTFYDAGSRSFYTLDKPILTPDDLKGLKIRVMESITAVKMVKALGGSPTPISWGELYTSLQNGVVDGAENNPPSFYLSHHYEVCKHYSLDEHTTIPDVLLMSTHTWNKLTDQEKKWLEESIVESLEVQRELWHEAEEEALREVQKAGVTVYRPDKAPFREKVKGIYEEYKETDPMMYDLIQRIQSIKTSEQ
jgi:tripartite ATP-independent transporter DctP family solute receptor